MAILQVTVSAQQNWSRKNIECSYKPLAEREDLTCGSDIEFSIVVEYIFQQFDPLSGFVVRLDHYQSTSYGGNRQGRNEADDSHPSLWSARPSAVREDVELRSARKSYGTSPRLCRQFNIFVGAQQIRQHHSNAPLCPCWTIMLWTRKIVKS